MSSPKLSVAFFATVFVALGHLSLQAQDFNSLLNEAVDNTKLTDRTVKPTQRPAPSPAVLIIMGDLRNAIEERNEFIKNTRILGEPPERLFGTKDYEKWLSLYLSMREHLRYDAGADSNWHCANVIRDAVTARPDFVEGRVLLILYDIYAGEYREAVSLLRQTRGLLESNGFDESFLGLDFCTACLLLRSDEGIGILRWLSTIENNKRPALATWLLAQSQTLSQNPTDAQKNYVRALQLADREEIAARDAAPLYGDAALFFLTSSLPALRNVDRAKRALANLDGVEDVDCWQATRAEAALLASNGEWEKAQEKLKTAMNQCPPHLAHELIGQQTAYSKENEWFQ